MNIKLWFIGTPIDGTRWMVECVFDNEDDAAANVKDGEFIVRVSPNMRLPVSVLDAEKLYYPKNETWEESALYKLRNGGNDEYY